jgi:hypothetical protein
MAYYLVRARAKPELLPELERQLREGAFLDLRPFGWALSGSLSDTRTAEDGYVLWEEEDYCQPPLAQERAAVLDRHFEDLETELVTGGEGWQRIASLPRLFPGLTSDSEPRKAGDRILGLPE